MSEILDRDFRVTFGRVINKKTDPSAQSAIDCMLKADNNMFDNAQAIDNYMRLCKLSKRQTGERLGIDEQIVIHKLLLLKFTKTQRQIILKSGICEKCAVDLAKLYKNQRSKVLKELAVLKLSAKDAQDFIYKSILEIEKTSKPNEKRIGTKKIIINDVGFFINTVNRAVKTMQIGGYQIENIISEDEKEYRMDIKVKKNIKNN